MEKLENYIIVYAFNTDDLEKKVNSKIVKGYIPLGGVSVLAGKYKDFAGGLYQSMILDKPKVEKKEKIKIEPKKEINLERAINISEIFFCPECGTVAEEYRNGIWGCGNEDCDFETDNIDNLNQFKRSIKWTKKNN